MEVEEGGKRGDGDEGRFERERPLRALLRLRGWLLLSKGRLAWPKFVLLYAIEMKKRVRRL